MNHDLIIAPDSSEDHVIELWVRLKRSLATQRAYRHDIDVFRSFVKKPLVSVTLEDALNFVEALDDLEIVNKRGVTKRLEDNSKRRMLNAVKSLYSFAYDSGFFRVNVFRAVKPPTAKSAISQRILTEAQVLKMIVLEDDPRNHAILHTLYASAIRVSELCNLKWRSVIHREDGDGVQFDVVGKGDKPRSILLKESAWPALAALRTPDTKLDDFVFRSRQDGREGSKTEKRLDASQVFRIVRQAAKQSGIPNWFEVSPHWLRHCHGSHSIQRGAPITVVRDTMGHSSIAVTNTYATARPNESSSLYLPL
jgi:integrase/recombinase XerD